MAVTPADVANTLGRPTPSSGSTIYKQWNLWISDARLIVRGRLGDLDALDQADLDFVVREAVAEKARRGDGTTSETVSVDDGSVTKRWENGTSSQINILAEWWDLLTPDVEDNAGAFTIRPYAERARFC